MPTIQFNPVSANAILAAGQYKKVYTAPLGCVSATVNARMVSHDLLADIKTRMAIVPDAIAFVDGAVPPPDDYWSHAVDLILGPSGISTGVIEDTSLVLSPGESIVMYIDSNSANARVHGIMRSMGV